MTFARLYRRACRVSVTSPPASPSSSRLLLSGLDGDGPSPAPRRRPGGPVGQPSAARSCLNRPRPANASSAPSGITMICWRWSCPARPVGSQLSAVGKEQDSRNQNAPRYWAEPWRSQRSKRQLFPPDHWYAPLRTRSAVGKEGEEIKCSAGAVPDDMYTMPPYVCSNAVSKK